MAIQKKSETLKKKPTDEDEDTDGAPAESPAPDEGEAPKTKVKQGEKVEAKPNAELSALVTEYDENVAAAEASFIALVEYIQDNQVDRATVIATLMLARSITFEQAQNVYTKMKKIFNNAEVLQDLKDGKITLKVAREKTKGEPKKKKDSAADPAKKEAKFTNTLKNFVAAAKESGFSRSEIMVSVEAELKSAGIK